jgi:cytidylate kinase
VTSAVSAVAATPEVRKFLVELQRAWIRDRGSGVVEGRDITTVVLPDADLKLFVTASPRVRAERRVAESGGDVDAVEAAIAERDRRDETREASPLSIASEAVVIDTSEMSIDDVVADVLKRVRG